mgnify:CR=1 FL=1
MPPPLSHIVYGFVYDINSSKLSEATITLTHSTGSISGTTDANGEYNLNLGNLPDVWAVGNEITIKATKSAEGTKTITTTIKSGGAQQENITLAETSDFVYDTQVQNRTNIMMSIPLHYDGLKVTRERPLPVQTMTDRRFQTRTTYTANGFEEYFGEAATGVTESELKWRISKRTYDSDDREISLTWANRSAKFDKRWDQRTTYDYT